MGATAQLGVRDHAGEPADQDAGIRPTIALPLSLDAMHAMASREGAPDNGDLAVAGRMEAIIETFAWLAGWEPDPPVDRHGHLEAEDCAERHVPCVCDSARICLRAGGPACRRVPCVHGFGQDIAI